MFSIDIHCHNILYSLAKAAKVLLTQLGAVVIDALYACCDVYDSMMSHVVTMTLIDNATKYLSVRTQSPEYMTQMVIQQSYNI